MAKDFGTTWWGEAWLDALEGIAGGRGSRLARGRRWAKANRGADLHIEPGGVNAWVQADRDEPHEVHVGIRPFRDDEWDTVLDAIAAKAAHAAALLDGELDPGIVADAQAVEVDLLPRPRDLRTVCTCPDDVEPCEHAAAVCHLLADALDDDPFVLLLLRGRRRDEVLDEVRRRRGGGVVEDAGAERTSSPATGIDAAEAWHRQLSPLPHVPIVANAPGRPAAWPSDPPAHAPFDGPGLRTLVADAARRAWELCAGTVDTGLELDERSDLARRAVGASPAVKERLAAHSGIATVDLDVLAAAWQFAGAAGVRAHDEPRWNPPPLEMARARDLVIDAGMVARRVHISGNRITAEGRVQLRRSRDGRWYLFTKSTGRWAMAAPPEDDVDDLLDHDVRG
ncbi:MAG TPA: SWIM zinc finger family protein [Acidimicrobiales bacterium]|nr:SWIM zinc finger family protein [Acidimicrobiales bacterium]